jgi:hypothetical protein
MELQYFNFIYRLILDESMLYIEKNNLPDYADLQKILKTKQQDFGTQVDQLKFVYSLPGKYPELEARIKSEIEKANIEIMKDFWAAMDAETAVKALKLMNDDMDLIEKFASKYLTPETEKA